jgi:hypothetical protein
VGLAVFCGIGLLVVLARSLVFGIRPGWDYASIYVGLLGALALYDLSLHGLGPILVARLRTAAGPLAAHGLLVAALYAAITHAPSAPFLLALAGLAHLFLWSSRRGSITPVFWLISLSLSLWSIYLDAWWFSVIGDEYEFYRYARDLLEKANPASIGRELYNATGVYSTHPGFSSLIQVAGMALFGPGLFGWRFSGGYLAALSLWPFYSYVHALGGRRLAVVASTLLAVSHYLMSFGKIGYNNLQALFTFSVGLAAATWFARRPSVLAAAGFGIALGASFFVFPVALLTLPATLLIASLGPSDRPPLRAWLIVGLVLLPTALPMMVQQSFWATKPLGTLSFDPAGLLAMLTNLAMAIASFVWVAGESHFVAVGVVDFVTGFFVVLGVGAALRRPIDRRAAALLAATAVLLLLVGAVHGYGTPPLTRMFLWLPFLAVFGALGLRWLEESLIRQGVGTAAVQRITLAFLGLIVLTNVLQAYPLSRQRMASQYQSPQVLLLREAENLLTPGPNNARLVLLALPERNLRSSLAEYLELNLGQFDAAYLIELDPQEVTNDELADPRAILLVDHRLPDAIQTELETRLLRSGKVACRFRNSMGDIGLVVWTAAAEHNRCAEAPYRW